MVEFVPLCVPWERRLQTLVVLQWDGCLVSMGMPGRDRWPSLDTGEKTAYGVSSEDGHHRFHHHVCNMPAVRPGLVKTAGPDPSRNYLAGFHPHEIAAVGAFTSLCTEGTGFSSLFPGIRSHLMMLNLWFWAPVSRDYIMMGGMVAADKESVSHILSNEGGGNLLAIIVGGVQEALESRPGGYKLVLRNRKGFIRLALMHGADLVPIFSFGENDIYEQVENSPGTWLRWFQDGLPKVTGGSIPLFYGRGVFQYSFGLMPYRRPVTTWEAHRGAEDTYPSQEEVDRLHQRYMKELENLFEAHKLKYSVPRDQHLEFYRGLPQKRGCPKGQGWH